MLSWSLDRYEYQLRNHIVFFRFSWTKYWKFWSYSQLYNNIYLKKYLYLPQQPIIFIGNTATNLSAIQQSIKKSKTPICTIIKTIFTWSDNLLAYTLYHGDYTAGNFTTETLNMWPSTQSCCMDMLISSLTIVFLWRQKLKVTPVISAYTTESQRACTSVLVSTK